MEYESKLTDIIASLPEVDGGFLYDPTRGIYSNQTAGTVDDLSLLQVSTKLSKIVSMLAVHFHDTGGIRVTFKDLIDLQPRPNHTRVYTYGYQRDNILCQQQWFHLPGENTRERE